MRCGCFGRYHEGVLLDANIITMVIYMTIFYINELCIMLVKNILRKINKN